MKVYKFYSPEMETTISSSEFMPEYKTRLLGWTNEKKYRNWFIRTRLPGTFNEIISEIDPDSDDWEELQIEHDDKQLIATKLKIDNNASMGVVIPRIVQASLEIPGMIQFQTSLSMIYDLIKIPERILSEPFQKALTTLSYDIICDDTGDDFSLEAEDVRNGTIPIFWHYLFMDYKYLDVDGIVETSKYILKYLEKQEEEDEE